MWDMARFYIEYQSNEFLQPLVGEVSSNGISLFRPMMVSPPRTFVMQLNVNF